MTKERETLALQMIRMYGFEDERTIEYVKLCENETFAIEHLETILDCHKWLNNERGEN